MQSGQLSYSGTSNAGPPGLPYPNTTSAWNTIIKGLGCPNSTIEESFACVQNAPASTIKNISEHQELLFSPLQDNETLVSDLTARRHAKNIARVPLLIGTNQNEGSLVGGLFYTNLTTYLTTTFGWKLTPELLENIKRVYPVGSEEFPTTRDVITAIETDISMQCGTALVANDTAASGLPTWRYIVSISNHHPILTSILSCFLTISAPSLPSSKHVSFLPSTLDDILTQAHPHLNTPQKP